MWCIKNGIPYDVAWSLSDEELLAHCVVFGEYEGGEFSWERGEWLKKD